MAWNGATSVVDDARADVVATVVEDTGEAVVVTVVEDAGEAMVVVDSGEDDPQAVTKHTTNTAATVLVVTNLMAFSLR